MPGTRPSGEQSGQRSALVVELSGYHHHFLRSVIDVLAGWDRTVVTTPEVRDLCGRAAVSGTQWIIRERQVPTWRIILRAIAWSWRNPCDLLIVDTVQGNLVAFFCLFALARAGTKLLGVHNINVFQHRHGRTLRFAIKHLIRRLILLRVDGVNLLSEAIGAEWSSREPGIPALYIPFSCFVPAELHHLPSERFIIVVPGGVDHRRRDYATVLEACLTVKREVGHSFELVLLGKVKTDEDAEFIRRYDELSDCLTWYEAFVPEETYDSIMQKASLIIGPNKPSVMFEDTVEYYGLTKESGISFAMISYALPGALPRDLPAMRELEASTVRYGSSRDLADTIVRVVRDGQYRTSLKRRALEVSRMFTPEAVAARELPKLQTLRARAGSKNRRTGS
jgi:glycosyltransferase involved in cell wall biosynthesis